MGEGDFIMLNEKCIEVFPWHKDVATIRFCKLNNSNKVLDENISNVIL